MIKNSQVSRGFTLIEILVVIGLIAILAAIVLIAINPARQFAQARNSAREADLNAILNAVGQNIADNKGIFTCAGVGSLSGATTSIGTGGTNFNCLVPTYLASGIPMDPSNGTAANTGYTVSTTTAGRFILCADGHAEAAIPGSVSYCLTR